MHPTRSAQPDPNAIDRIADEVVALLGTGGQIAPFSGRIPGFDLERAYAVTAAVRRRREAAGERPVGRKIGFTNRTIWARYNVHAPIWSHVYDSTVHVLRANTPFSLAGLSEPRIEPEIVFGLGHTPQPGAEEAALLDCIDWVAHGFEIVQSVFPGWTFLAADTVAAFGLHGALLVGPRHPVTPRRAAWAAELASFEVDLCRDGAPVDRGRAANVLGGPLSALRHLVDLLAQDKANPPLAAGEIVTTGTLTDAFAVTAGERWTTRFEGIGLDGAALTFS